MASPTETAAAWLNALDHALRRQDAFAAASLFADQSYWRDLVAFTWNIKTMEGREAIAGMLSAVLAFKCLRAHPLDLTKPHQLFLLEANGERVCLALLGF